MSKKQLKQSIITLLSLGLIFLANSILWGGADWNGPTANPPSGNIAAPVNVSSVAQDKAGDLAIGSGLNYWITKYYDSFALKNNAGQIKFVLGQDGHVGIGTDAPVGLLDVKKTVYKYQKTDVEEYYSCQVSKRCPCDIDHYKKECDEGFYAANLLNGLIYCYDCHDNDPYANTLYSTFALDPNWRIGFSVNDAGRLVIDGSILDTDSDDAVATKEYVDNKNHQCVSWLSPKANPAGLQAWSYPSHTNYYVQSLMINGENICADEDGCIIYMMQFTDANAVQWVIHETNMIFQFYFNNKWTSSIAVGADGQGTNGDGIRQYIGGYDYCDIIDDEVNYGENSKDSIILLDGHHVDRCFFRICD